MLTPSLGAVTHSQPRDVVEINQSVSRNQFLGVDTRHEQTSSSEYIKEVKREESVRRTKCRCGSYPDVVEGCFVSDVIEKEES